MMKTIIVLLSVVTIIAASCGGDPNATPGCGTNCGRRCSDYNKVPEPCLFICILNGCDCKKGYVLDKNTGKCVLPNQCTTLVPEYNDYEEINNDADPTNQYRDPKKRAKYYLEKYKKFIDWFMGKGGEVKTKPPCDGDCETSDTTSSRYKSSTSKGRPGYIATYKTRTTRKPGYDLTYRSSTSKGRATYKTRPSKVDFDDDEASKCLVKLLGWGQLASGWGK